MPGHSRPERLEARLRSGPPLLADGAMGTELQKRGLPMGTASAGFTTTHPDAVLEVHRAYVSAGSRLLLTNTFGLPAPLSGAVSTTAQPGENVRGLVTRAVGLAREAAGETGYVAASIGPLAIDPAEAREQATTLALCFDAAGADALWLESQLSLTAALAMLEGARSVTRLPLLVSFSFHGPRGTTHSGDTPAACIEALARLGVCAVGGNCGDRPERLAPVLRSMHAAVPDLPLIAKPNAGSPEMCNGRPKYRIDPDVFRGFLDGWLEAGARVVGGCCGTTPAFIAALGADLLTLTPDIAGGYATPR